MGVKKYVVISLSVGGLRGKVFRKGDVVTASQLDSSPEKLVEDGFLEEKKSKKKSENKTDDSPSEPVTGDSDEGNDSDSDDDNGSDDDTIPEYEDITRDEISAKLTKNDVEHNPKDAKRDLYDLLVAAK